MDKALFYLVAWAICFVALFGGTHLLAYAFGWDPNDVVGWMVLGVVCSMIARGRE
jgi:ABC-type uncharacterized transport system permease subunit